MAIKTVSISFLGIDERSKSAYEIFFRNIKKVKCELVDNYSQAQLCLVDNDSYNIKKNYEALVKDYPDLYILILSLSEYGCQSDKEFFIRKPVKKDEFQNLMNEICGMITGQPIKKTFQAEPLQNKTKAQITQFQSNKSTATDNIKSNTVKPEAISSDNKIVPIKEPQNVSTANVAKMLKVEHEEHFIGNQPNIDINNPEQLKEIYYDPRKFLQSFVEQACINSHRKEQIIQLNILNHIFYFDYKEQKIYSSIGPGIIRPLCLVTHDKNITVIAKDDSFREELHRISQTNKNQTSKKALEKQSWDMESFMWLITLWSSRGRIPQGTDLKQPVYLTQWPNLTRLETIPHAVRIAALLYDQPYTLAEAAKQLNIEQRYVFAFFSACKSIGLANTTKRNVDGLFSAEKPKASKNKSILSRILNKLVSFSDKPSMNVTA